MGARADGPPICRGGKGLFFPATQSEQDWPDAVRAILYVLALCYSFLGVNIVADRFMNSIEAITSKKLRVLDKTTGRLKTVMRWNDTVANLTLLALGSSAPEILLSCVEIARGGFYSGALGPSTIVGSAAFNLFVIVGVCISSIPSPELRQIRQTGVFAVTAVFSLVCYGWLVFIVQWNSPDVVDIWEAAVTLGFFPILIYVSYLVDIGWFNRFFSSPEEEQDGEEEEEEDDEKEEAEEEEDAEHQADQNAILDENAKPIICPAGIVTFEEDILMFTATTQQQKLVVKVFRRNGSQGAISCKYRTERLSAAPGFDYEDIEGELEFEDGQTEAEISIVILPKQPWESDDEFQVILEDLEGGAQFNPHNDGGEDCAFLTITLTNSSEELGTSFKIRCMTCLDRLVNFDDFRIGTRTWYNDVFDMITDINGSDWDVATKFDWAVYFFLLPWNLTFALFLPPTPYLQGYLSFTFCIGYIAVLTTVILDIAELFGCVAGIKDGITAITFVALGTSMPDLFASKTAAVQDEYADASIVNVTGSNSVNVLLGIGLPWTFAAVYWRLQGATPEWVKTYEKDLPKVVEQYKDGAFVVPSGDLTFSVVVFTLGAFVALALIKFRRSKYGGELGGPFKQKILSSAFLFFIWTCYILLSIWKMAYNLDDVGPQIQALCTIENILFAIGVGFNVAYASISVSDIADKINS